MGKAAEIDRICDHFEEAYRNGEQPSIDEFVSNAPTDIRQQLQIELNALVADLSVEPTRPSMRIQKPDRQEYPPLECPKCHLDSLFVGSSASELRCGNPRCGHNFELQPKGEPKLAKVSYFEIVGLIGQGGFGRVWLARSEIDGIYVALKTPRIDTAPELIELFIKETRYAYQILDDGRTAGRIPQLIASGRDNGIDYLAFEFIPGNPLSMLIAQGTVTVKKAIGITLQIAETLQLAHENGLVHRDIKPGNILISKGNAYLCDFGIAKVVSGTIREAVKTEEGFTGTWAYASPEHAQPENLDARSDVFSLGIVLYELLANRRPFQSNTPEQEYERIRDPDQNAPLLTSFKPGISPALESICAKCISKKPTNRFQSAGEFAAELSRYLASALQAGLTAENAALSGTQAAEPNLSSERPSNIVDNHRNTLNRPANPLKRSWFAVACIFLILLTVFASVLLTPSDNAEILARLEQANAKVTMIYHDHTNRETTLGNGVTEKFANLMMSPLDPRVEFENITAVEFLEPTTPDARTLQIEDFASLQLLPKLQTLIIRRTGLAEREFAEEIGKLKNLSTLHFRSADNSQWLSAFGHMDNLVELQIIESCNFQDGEFFDRAPKLKSLFCTGETGATISKAAAQQMAEHKELIVARLWNPIALTEESVQLLVQSKRLNKLHLGGETVNTQMVQFLIENRGPNLEEFGINPNVIDANILVQTVERSKPNSDLPLTLVFEEDAADFTQELRERLKACNVQVYPPL